MDEFNIPGEPQELWEPDSELPFRCEAYVDMSEAPEEEVGDAAESERGEAAGARGFNCTGDSRRFGVVYRNLCRCGACGAADGCCFRPADGAPLVAPPPPLAHPVAALRCSGAAEPAACLPCRPPLLPTRTDLAFVLCDQDPLCIVEQANFDALCSLVAAWPRVGGPQRRQLIDSLCSSLTCLNAWIDKLLGAPADAQEPDAVRQHRSAYKAYIFFLAWISGVAAREAREALAAGNAADAASGAAPSGRGRKKKGAAGGAGALAGWDWSAMFPKMVKAVAGAFNTDLWALFRPSTPDEAMLMRSTQLVRRGSRGECVAGGQVSGMLGGLLLGQAPPGESHYLLRLMLLMYLPPPPSVLPHARPPALWRTPARSKLRSRRRRRRTSWRWQPSSISSWTT